MGIATSYQGARAGFCFQILLQTAKHPSELGQLMPRKFSEGMRSSCLLPDSMHYQFTRDEACGCCLVSGHIHTRSVFSCPAAV